MLKHYMSFRHLRMRTFIASAFGTIVVIGFRTIFLVSEFNFLTMRRLASTTSMGWAPRVQTIHYDWSRSTEDNYKADITEYCGTYGAFRERLDHTYHSNYTKSRQLLQDTVIDIMLYGTRITDSTGKECAAPTQPWIVFTAGAMGAGKSWTIRNLAHRGYFPLQSFVTVDPDDIRRHLPEFDVYVSKTPQQAGEFTKKEAGYIAETMTQIALQRGLNVLVDGTLRDCQWYTMYFKNLRAQRANLKIAILHITAPHDAVMERANQRARITGRVVPLKTLELAMKEVPKSVEILAPLSDFYAEIHNAPDTPNVEIRTKNMTWEDFKNVWVQSCNNEPIDDCIGSEIDNGSKDQLSAQ